jgi:MoaA/NifB/PqqE/SkfB family radical SAM enzyme
MSRASFRALLAQHKAELGIIGLKGVARVFVGEVKAARNTSFIYKYRALARQVNKIVGAPQLFGLFICPSHQCNANCVHCLEKMEGHDKRQLSTGDVKRVVDEFCALKGAMVHFCSGEFLLRKDAVEIIEYCRDASLKVCLTSNGIILNEKKIDEIKKAGVTRIIVSIDSADPAKHDALRRVPGCFDKAVNALKLAKARGIETKIYSYVSRSNSGELDGVGRLAAEIGVEKVYVFFPLLSGHYFDKPEENLTFEEREALRKKYAGHPNVELEFPTEDTWCQGGGKLHMCVMPNGEVTFCPPVPYSYGNIRSKSLKACLDDMVEDHVKLCRTRCTGQCPVNFMEYREGCNARFIY